MLRVGLTGGIASGKSTVASILRSLDFPVLEADSIGHALIELGQPAYGEVVREFGPEILAPNGHVDRGKLGAIVFADPARRARLNQILHPRILDVARDWFVRLERADPPQLAFVSAALIVEAGYNKELDRLIDCWCPGELQLERLAERGLSHEQARQRIEAQMPIEDKARMADDVIDCSGSVETAERQVRELIPRLLQFAACKKKAC